MYNKSGSGKIGYHYDPLFPATRLAPSGGVAVEPVIQEISGEGDRAAKLRQLSRIREGESLGELVLEGPGAEDGDQIGRAHV